MYLKKVIIMTRSVQETLDYVRQFRGRIIVVKINKNVLANKEKLDSIVGDIVLLKNAGVDIVVTHSDVTFTGKSWLSLEPAVFLDINSVSGIAGQMALGITPIVFFDETPSLSSEKAIASLAIRLGAIKIVYITNYDGIFQSGGILIHEMDLAQARNMLELPGAVTQETRARLEVAIMACEQGIPRIHIIGSREGSLLKEIFTCDGSGTMIYESMYQEIKPAKKSDVTKIFEAIKNSMKKISISLDFIEKNIGNFWVFAVDRQIHGCMLVEGENEKMTSKIEYLSVSTTYESPLIFERLIRHALSVIATETKCVFLDPEKNTNLLGMYPWFKKLGFSKQPMCCGPRNSKNKVWVKMISE